MPINYVFGAFGLIVLSFGLWQLNWCIRFLLRSTRVEGRLVKWEMISPGFIGTPPKSVRGGSYRPVVAFKADDGTEHRVESGVWRRSNYRPSTPVGTVYPVRYNPRNPQEARIATVTDMWMIPSLCVVFGAFIIAVGMFHQ